MALIEINTNPPENHLKIFGRYLFPVFTLLLSFVLSKWGVGRTGITICLSIGVLVMMIGWTNYKLVRYIMIGLMVRSLPIALTVSYLALFIAYYVVITPTGLIMRVFGKDLLSVRIDEQSESYWIDHSGTPEPQQYFRQF